MSQNVMVICNTFSQLLMAIQLKSTIMADDRLTVIATDKSPMNESLLERVRKLGYFNEVSFTMSLHYCRRNTIKDKLADVVDIVKGRNITGNSFGRYDLMLYYNLDLTTIALYAELYKYNHKIECARYEEGILSYNNPIINVSALNIDDIFCFEAPIALKIPISFVLSYTEIYVIIPIIIEDTTREIEINAINT